MGCDFLLHLYHHQLPKNHHFLFVFIYPVFDTPWQFGGAFAYKGGVLQAGGSDIVLSVPIGAVPRDQAIDIYGSIFTDTANIRRKVRPQRPFQRKEFKNSDCDHPDNCVFLLLKSVSMFFLYDLELSIELGSFFL